MRVEPERQGTAMKQLNAKRLPAKVKRLIARAVVARRRAYAPYSNYRVGVAVESAGGKYFVGKNVESADYTLTVHAETDALNAMVHAGEPRVRTVLVVVQSDIGWGFPCGLCRQRIREFAGRGPVTVYGVNLDARERVRDVFRSTLDELLPYSFGPEFL